MVNSHIHAALARERVETLLAEANTARRAEQARQHQQQAAAPSARRPPRHWLSGWLSAHLGLPGHRTRSAARGRRVVLRDGSAVRIRQVQPADAPLLADGFTSLSDTSRRMRFLRPKDELSTAELRYFTAVDHHDHEALGALDAADGRGVGIARYIRHTSDPLTAEIAVTVVDDWQRRGLGTELLALLANRARAAGIRRFTARVSADNAPVAGLLRNMNANLTRRELSTCHYEITLAPGAKSGDGQPSQFPR